MPKIKLRFGSVNADETIPPVDAIAEDVEERNLVGGLGNWHGVDVMADGDQYVTGDDYIFLRYKGELTQEREEFDEEGNTGMRERHLPKIMHFLLTRDGEYAFESKTGVSDKRALEYLVGEESHFEIPINPSRYGNFTRDQMEEFYENTFSVRGLKAKEIGEDESDDVSGNVEELVSELGEPADWLEVSTGSDYNNLGTARLTNGFARLSDIKKVRGLDSESELRVAQANGRFSFSHPPDADLEELGERTRAILEEVLDGLTRDRD